MTSTGCNLIIFGPPGAGKGTQARVLSEALDVPHIDCGYVVRDEVSAKTEFGRKAEELIVEGHLVPDELIIGMMLNRLREPDCKSGYVLDGFPRTTDQALGLDEYMRDNDRRLDYIVNLGLDEETAVKRLSSRRYCPSNGRVYNVLTAPPKIDGKCDECGGDLIQRADDKPETVRERMSVYETETASLIDYYKNADGYIEIDGGRDVEIVASEILAMVRESRRCS